MAYKYIERLIPNSKYQLKATYSMKAEYITVHNTYNDASAENEIKYMSGNNSATSYHFAIDDKEVIQAVPLNRNAWHCGDGANGKGNRASIGIEICYSKSGGPKYVAAEENAVQYIAKLLKTLGWKTDKIVQHNKWSGKDCPHRIRKEKRWDSFIKRIETAMNTKVVEQAKKPVEQVVKPVAKPTITTPKEIGTLKVLVDNLNYYDGPRWNKPSGQVKKNTVFTVIGKIEVDGAYQYKLKSGNYITAAKTYVKFTAK